MAAAMAILACLAGFALPAAAKKNKLNPAAVALFKKAIQASDIQSKGSPAFQLHATVSLAGANSQRPVGTLVEFWTPEGKRREMTSLQGFQLLEVSDGRHLWTKNTANFLPYDVYEFWAALAFAKELRWWSDTSERLLFVAGVVRTYSPSRANVELGRPKLTRKENEYCVEAKTSRRHKKEFCFDRSTGNLLRLTDDDGVSYEYSNYAEFGRKMFPRTIRAFNNHKTGIFEIQIDHIDVLNKPAQGTFLPKKGWKEGPDESMCARVKSPKATSMRAPVYPPEAKNSHIEGRVTIYGYIGIDGVPRGLLPLSSPSPLLTNAALNAVSQWRYRPLVCGTGSDAQPAPAITYITTTFRLGY